MVARRITVSDKELDGGEVVWFNPQKLYGFVKPFTGGKEIFFHSNNEKWVSINEPQCDKLIFIIPKVRSVPIPGEIIFFIKNTSGKGNTKASPWVREINLSPVLQDLDYFQKVCDCGHKMIEHSSGHECTLCSCGNDWQSANDPDNFVEVKLLNSRTGVQVVEGLEVSLTGEPGGPTTCQ